MDKYINFLTKLGFTKSQIEDIEKDETDIDSILKDFNSNKFELFKADADYNNSLKSESKKQGLAEAYTKAKKTLNNKFALALTNKELDEIDYDIVLERAQEKLKGAGNEEVSTLNNTIFDLNTKLQNKEAEIETERLKIKNEFDNKLNNIQADSIFRKQVFSKKRIIPEDEAITYLKTRLSIDGISTKVDDKGNISFLKDGYPLKKNDNIGFETLESIDEKYLGSFVEKSNGSGTPQTQQTQGGNNELVLSPTLQKYLENGVNN